MPAHLLTACSLCCCNFIRARQSLTLWTAAWEVAFRRRTFYRGGRGGEGVRGGGGEREYVGVGGEREGGTKKTSQSELSKTQNKKLKQASLMSQVFHTFPKGSSPLWRLYDWKKDITFDNAQFLINTLLHIILWWVCNLVHRTIPKFSLLHAEIRAA